MTVADVQELQSIKTSEDGRARADSLRSLMYGDPDFMRDVRQGMEEEYRGEGMTLVDYKRTRGLA